MHDSVICICSKLAFREQLWQTVTDPDKSLQAYVDRTQISRVKFWRPGPKGRQMAAKKVMFLVTGTMKLFFLCNGIDWHEIPANNVNQCPLLNLNKRILKKISLKGVILPQNHHFVVVLMDLRVTDLQVKGYQGLLF